MNSLRETLLGRGRRAVTGGGRTCWPSWDRRLGSKNGGSRIEGVRVVDGGRDDTLRRASTDSVGESGITSRSGLTAAVARSSTIGCD